MRFDFPTEKQIPQLLQLWKAVFGDYGGFWELFLHTDFRADHCRCITENGQLAAALYWFDCSCAGDKTAYIYAVVTNPSFRGRGLCRALMEDTHRQLAALGYASVLLVPESEGLRSMYRKMGYRDCTGVKEVSCTAGETAVSIRSIDPEAFASLRRRFLSEKGVVQERENLTFLAAQAQLYAGGDFLLAAYAQEDVLHGMELLGNPDAAPGILRALGFSRGVFRMPGEDKPFAMFHPLKEDAAIPDYFGFAFD